MKHKQNMNKYGRRCMMDDGTMVLDELVVGTYDTIRWSMVLDEF
jgi:hypothetical protein